MLFLTGSPKQARGVPERAKAYALSIAHNEKNCLAWVVCETQPACTMASALLSSAHSTLKCAQSNN